MGISLRYYKKKTVQGMYAWDKDTDMKYVTLPYKEYVPEKGDMIAVSKIDTNDTWLITERFFRTNYQTEAV